MPQEQRIGGGFTEGELKFAGFWVRNGVKMRKIGWGVLIGANVLLWGYVLWGLLDAYVISYPRESRITADIAANNFAATRLAGDRPQSVQTAPAAIFQGTEGRLDLVVPITNPNKGWWVEFSYRFNVSGEYTPMRSGFLLPGEKTYLGEFGFKPTSAGARSGTLTVDDIRWHRVDPAQVGDNYASWAERRWQFQSEEVQFISEAGAGAQRLSRSQFTFVNPSAYGFWSVKLYVILKRGGAPIAASTITLDRVRPGERRPVNLDWYEQLPSVTETEIIPVVNLLDESAYLPL